MNRFCLVTTSVVLLRQVPSSGGDLVHVIVESGGADISLGAGADQSRA